LLQSGEPDKHHEFNLIDNGAERVHRILKGNRFGLPPSIAEGTACIIKLNRMNTSQSGCQIVGKWKSFEFIKLDKPKQLYQLKMA